MNEKIDKQRKLLENPEGKVEPGTPRMKLVPVFKIDGEKVYPDWKILKLKELLKPEEVAAILRVSRSHVYYLCWIGVLEYVKIGGCVRIKTGSVRKLLKESEKE